MTMIAKQDDYDMFIEYGYLWSVFEITRFDYKFAKRAHFDIFSRFSYFLFLPTNHSNQNDQSSNIV